MTDRTSERASTDCYTAAAVAVLLVLTSAMLLAMFTRTEPHPPLEVGPFALGPFLAASLAIGTAAYVLIARGARWGLWIALLFALTALVSYGPQKYFDAALPKIWPAVIMAQAAVAAIFVRAVRAISHGQRSRGS